MKTTTPKIFALTQEARAANAAETRTTSQAAERLERAIETLKNKPHDQHTLDLTTPSDVTLQGLRATVFQDTSFLLHTPHTLPVPLRKSPAMDLSVFHNADPTVNLIIEDGPLCVATELNTLQHTDFLMACLNAIVYHLGGVYQSGVLQGRQIHLDGRIGPPVVSFEHQDIQKSLFDILKLGETKAWPGFAPEHQLVQFVTAQGQRAPGIICGIEPKPFTMEGSAHQTLEHNALFADILSHVKVA